jgi:hypothetical protein
VRNEFGNEAEAQAVPRQVGDNVSIADEGAVGLASGF